MTETTLAGIYRKAAEIVIAEGKIEGAYAKTNGEDECFGYCTMGAVFRASGHMTDDYHLSVQFDGSEAQTRLIKPIADQVVSSGRAEDAYHAFRGNENERSWDVVQRWNDQEGVSKPSAADVAALLRETADAVERVND